MTHAAPVCPACKETGVRKIKQWRPIHCIVAILFWPIGIGLIIAAIGFFMSGNAGVAFGNVRVFPILAVVIACIPGFIVLAIAVRSGKRGFSKPENTFLFDCEERLKSTVLRELKGEDKQAPVFTASMKEAAGLYKENDIAHRTCKYPAPRPAPPPQVAPPAE